MWDACHRDITEIECPLEAFPMVLISSYVYWSWYALLLHRQRNSTTGKQKHLQNKVWWQWRTLQLCLSIYPPNRGMGEETKDCSQPWGWGHGDAGGMSRTWTSWFHYLLQWCLWVSPIKSAPVFPVGYYEGLQENTIRKRQRWAWFYQPKLKMRCACLSGNKNEGQWRRNDSFYKILLSLTQGNKGLTEKHSGKVPLKIQIWSQWCITRICSKQLQLVH